jgi:hypothetical protein
MGFLERRLWQLDAVVLIDSVCGNGFARLGRSDIPIVQTCSGRRQALSLVGAPI